MLVNGDPGDPESSTNWPVYADLLPHAINSRAVECHDTWVRTLVTNLVRYLMSSGDYRGALSLADSAWETWQETFGENHVDTLVMGRHRGNALRRVGRVAEAREVTDHVYSLMKTNLGEDHEATIAMADALMFIPRSDGRLYEERQDSERILERARRVLGEDDPATLRYANNLAARLRLAGVLRRPGPGRADAAAKDRGPGRHARLDHEHPQWSCHGHPRVWSLRAGLRDAGGDERPDVGRARPGPPQHDRWRPLSRGVPPQGRAARPGL
jgi:hypothetical protein